MSGPLLIRSRANSLLRDLRRLARQSGAARREGRVWVEGEHLCRAALVRGCKPALALFSETFWPQAPGDIVRVATKNIVVADSLWSGLSSLESPAPLAFVLELPLAQPPAPDLPTVVLDRLQDPGNAGSILRSAAAFGFAQVLALPGTVGLWSPKVLRAGMGAHFALRLVEAASVDVLAGLAVPLLATSSHQGEWLHRAALPWPCAWLFGHEGQGLAPALLAAADRTLRIAQPGGEESLNVAAAAAVCLHASAVGRGGA